MVLWIQLLVLSLACCFRLLLALNAGLLVVLTLAKIGQDVRPCALTLEATESTVQRLALFYLDFCHDFFPSPRIRRRSVADDVPILDRKYAICRWQTLCILYPISAYLSIGFQKFFSVFLNKNPRRLPRVFGADNQIRTDDLLITNEVLYRLSYISALSCDLPIIAYIANFVKRIWRIFFGDFAQRKSRVGRGGSSIFTLSIWRWLNCSLSGCAR